MLWLKAHHWNLDPSSSNMAVQKTCIGSLWAEKSPFTKSFSRNVQKHQSLSASVGWRKPARWPPPESKVRLCEQRCLPSHAVMHAAVSDDALNVFTWCVTQGGTNQKAQMYGNTSLFYIWGREASHSSLPFCCKINSKRTELIVVSNPRTFIWKAQQSGSDGHKAARYDWRSWDGAGILLWKVLRHI